MLYLVPWFECKNSLAVQIHTWKREKESQECTIMSRHNWWSTSSFCCLRVSIMKPWTCVMFRQQCQVSWTLNVRRLAWRLYHQLFSACQICNFLSQVVSAQDEEILELYHYNEGCATKFILHVITKKSYWKTNLLRIWITIHKDDIADIKDHKSRWVMDLTPKTFVLRGILVHNNL